MSARIPDTAKLIDTAIAILPSGRWQGRQITVQLYDGYASKGRKSGYDRIHHQWVKYKIVVTVLLVVAPTLAKTFPLPLSN